MHYAVHGNTAAKVIVARADHNKEHIALKFQSENMIEALDTAKLGLTVYYRTHDQEEEALKVESETEKIIMQIPK